MKSFFEKKKNTNIIKKQDKKETIIKTSHGFLKINRNKK